MVTITNPFSFKKLDDIKFWRGISGAMGGTSATSTGGTLTTGNAMRFSTVFACMRVLAESESALPLCLYRRKDPSDPQSDREKLFDDEWGYHDLITHEPVEGLNGQEWRDLMAMNRLSGGNDYYVVNRVGRSHRVAELLRYQPGSVTVQEKGTKDGLLLPEYRLNGKEIDQRQVLHFRGPMIGGFLGVSPITFAANTIEMGIELQNYGTRMQKNGGKPGGIVEMPPGRISDDQLEKTRKSFDETFAGNGQGKVAVMPNGAKFHGVAISSTDAQFIENRKFQRSDIAGIFRVPPHFVGDLEHATFSNIEHQAIQFVRYSLMPWITRTESTLNRSLLHASHRKQGLYFKYDVRSLLRGDSKAMAELIKALTMHVTSDEIREWFDMNDLPDGEGKTRIIPLNMLNSGDGENSEKIGSEKL